MTSSWHSLQTSAENLAWSCRKPQPPAEKPISRQNPIFGAVAARPRGEVSITVSQSGQVVTR